MQACGRPFVKVACQPIDLDKSRGHIDARETAADNFGGGPGVCSV